MCGSTVVITITLAIGDNGFQNSHLLAQRTVQPLWVLAAHPFCNLHILPPNHCTVVSIPSSRGKDLSEEKGNEARQGAGSNPNTERRWG